jgi:hypothetical protein
MASKYGSDYGQEVNDFVIPSDAQRFSPMSERYAIGASGPVLEGIYGSEYGKKIPDNMLVGMGGTEETGYKSIPGGNLPFDLNKLIGISPGSTSQYRNADSPSNRDIEREYNLLNRSDITNKINDFFGSNLSGKDIASRVAVLGGGLAGGLGMFAPNRQKVGYQGGIPKFTAERNMVTAPPAGSRPGAGGVNYSGDVTYTRQPGSPSTSSGGGGGGGGGGFDLGNVAKVAGGAGLAALLGNYLSKPGALSNISGGLNSILKGIGSGSGSGSGSGAPAGQPDEFTGIDKQIRDNLASQLPNQLSDEEVQAEFDRLRGEIPEYEMPMYEEPAYTEIPSYDDYPYFGAGESFEYAKGGGVNSPRYLQGETDGMADKIPARIGRDQPAALSHGEFVVPADVVSHLGNGNSDAGAKKLYSMMDKIRQARTGTKKQGKRINPDKFMPGGLAQAYAEGGSVKRLNVGGTTMPAGSTGSEQTLAGWTGDYIPNMLGKAEALASAPYQQYGGPLSAGASGLQQQAFQAAGNLSVPSSVGQATQTAGDIAAKAQGISYDPTKFDSQFKAPELSAATQFTNQFKAPDPYQSTAFKSGTFGQEQAQQYMNPYLQTSLNPQLEEARRQSNISEQANKAAMTKAGAFGGGRSAILTAENQRNLGTNLAGITGKGYDTAFQNAMSQFNADQARNMQAQQASEQSKQFGATQGMTAADMMAKYGMSAQQAQEAARQFNQGQSMTAAQQAAQYGQAAQQASEQSKQFGANLGLQGLQTGLQAAKAQGDLGISSGQLGLANLQQQAALGATQRGIEAEGIAADKAAFEQARENPYKMLQFQQSMLQGLPISATNYSLPEPDALTNASRGATTVNQLLKTLGLGGSESPKK